MAPEPSTSRGTETILLVDDDDQVRTVASKILRKSGYLVFDAANAGEALLVCERHTANIHLLLTDIVLPRLSGPELAARLAAARPAMKVLYMSGYADVAVLHDHRLESGAAFVQKPLTRDKLTRKVRQVLSGRGSGVFPAF
jgi:DNA-binding NtrC family response regulator